ncbi:MAG: hypothetical protein LBI70_03125 [Rickettsiales bacterium]|nr:hypothetical protein [Rickettsiales bacterium]
MNEKNKDNLVVNGISMANKPLFSLFREGADSVKSIKYHSYGANGELEGTLGVDYNKINQILNSGAKNLALDDLITQGAITYESNGVFSKSEKFSDIKPILDKNFKQLLQNRAALGPKAFDGGQLWDENLIMLANADNIDELRRIRFMSSFKPSYNGATSFLESMGINRDNLNHIAGDCISINAPTSKKDHVVCLTFNLKKIRDIGWNNINKSEDTFVYSYDSSRAVGAMDKNGRLFYRGGFGKLEKNTRALNCAQQKNDSCWYNVAASALMVAKNSELIRSIENKETKLYSLYEPIGEARNENVENDGLESLNTLMLEQIKMQQILAYRGGVGLVDNELFVKKTLSDDLVKRLEVCTDKDYLLKVLDGKIKKIAEKIENKYQARDSNFKLNNDRTREVSEKFLGDFSKKIDAIDVSDSLVENKTNEDIFSGEVEPRENIKKHGENVPNDSPNREDDDNRRSNGGSGSGPIARIVEIIVKIIGKIIGAITAGQSEMPYESNPEMENNVKRSKNKKVSSKIKTSRTRKKSEKYSVDSSRAREASKEFLVNVEKFKKLKDTLDSLENGEMEQELLEESSPIKNILGKNTHGCQGDYSNIKLLNTPQHRGAGKNNREI